MRPATPADLLARAQRDIENMLVFGGALEMSTFGLMVERAELYAFAKTTIAGDDLPYRLPALKEGGMKVKPTRGDGGYEVNEALAEVIARGTRWLSRVGDRSRVYRLALEAFYGDRGARWGLGPSKENAGGVGDRTFVLWPMTRMGSQWIDALRAKSPLGAVLRGDELLATEMAGQKRAPNEPRRLRLKACGEQARQLLGAAHACLQEVVVEAEQARQQRRIAREAVAA